MVRYQAIHSIEDGNRTYHIVLGGFGRAFSACCVGAAQEFPARPRGSACPVYLLILQQSPVYDLTIITAVTHARYSGY